MYQQPRSNPEFTAKDDKTTPLDLHTGFFERIVQAVGGLAKRIVLPEGATLEDLRDSIDQGGPLERSDDMGGYALLALEPLGRLRNKLFSCFYFRTEHQVESGIQIRESLDIIRTDKIGGAHLRFTDGKLVGGVTNAIRRYFFDPHEEELATEILNCVRGEFTEDE